MSDTVLEDFDYWLATRREAIKNYLSPNSYSEYSGMDNTLSLQLFLLCTHPKVNLLKLRYDVFIKRKNQFIDSFYNEKDIPKKYKDPDTNCLIDIDENEDIRVYFELLSEPETEPEYFFTSSGKQDGVGYVEVKSAVLSLADIL